MKRIISFLNTLALSSGLLLAQVSFYASDVNPNAGNNVIVRNWENGNATITYLEYGLKKQIQYVDYTYGTSYLTDVPDYLQIYDMYIFNDIVYYCGYSVIDTGGPGVIGYFDPVEFLSSSQMTFRTLPVRPLTHVNKLVAQKNNSGGVEVIAIGEHRWTDTVHVGNSIQNVQHNIRQFVYCYDITLPSVTYDTIPIPSEERYFDVLLTDNYVVFVGLGKYTPQSTICLRIEKRAAFPSYALIMDVYGYPTGVDEVLSTMHSASMNGDTIATAYMYIDATSGAVSNRLRTFDIQQLTMVNSQEYVVSDKSEATDIVYIPEDRSIVCMHDFVTPSGCYNSNFVYLDPYATENYAASIEYIKGNFFQSLTTKGEKHYLASQGQYWFLKEKPNIGAYSDTDCPMTEEINHKVLENWLKVTLNRPIFPNYNSVFIQTDVSGIHPRNVSVICNNF